MPGLAGRVGGFGSGVGLLVLVCGVALVACGVRAESPPATRTSAATPVSSGAIRPDGAMLTVRLTDGRQVKLRGFRQVGRSGLSQARCGVTITGRRVVTLGVGDTEVYSCDGLAAAGVVPPAGGVQRIGLIYDASSPNAEFRTAVVLREDGGWHVDPAFAGRFDDTPASRSIGALRRALR